MYHQWGDLRHYRHAVIASEKALVGGGNGASASAHQQFTRGPLSTFARKTVCSIQRPPGITQGCI